MGMTYWIALDGSFIGSFSEGSPDLPKYAMQVPLAPPSDTTSVGAYKWNGVKWDLPPGGGAVPNVVNITSMPYTILTLESTLNIENSGTLYLPLSPVNAQKHIIINDSAGVVTIDGNGKTISGGETSTLSTRYVSLDLTFNFDKDDWMAI